MKSVGGRIPTVIHAGCADTPTTIELAKDAVDKGADSIAVIPPYYFEHNDDEVLLHFTQVCKAVPHPLFVYNNWVNSGYRMNAAWTTNLSKEIPDLCGIKMSFLPLDFRQGAPRFLWCFFGLRHMSQARRPLGTGRNHPSLDGRHPRVASETLEIH